MARSDHGNLMTRQPEMSSLAARVRRQQREARALHALERSYVRELGAQLRANRGGPVNGDPLRPVKEGLAYFRARTEGEEGASHAPAAAGERTGMGARMRRANGSFRPVRPPALAAWAARS
jgi:hypothetical protein